MYFLSQILENMLNMYYIPHYQSKLINPLLPVGQAGTLRLDLGTQRWLRHNCNRDLAHQ